MEVVTKYKKDIIAAVLALTLAVLYAFSNHQWELESTRFAFWGDSFPNTDHVFSALRTIISEEDGIGPWHESLYVYGTRPPALFILAAAYLSATEISHLNLMTFQVITLLFGSLCLYGATRLMTASVFAAICTQAIFLFAPETINQGHNFLQAAPSATCICASLLGVMLCRKNLRFGPLFLGLALGVGLLVRKQMVFMAAAPLALYALPSCWHWFRQRPTLSFAPLLLPLLGAALLPLCLKLGWVEEGFHPGMFLFIAMLSLGTLAIPKENTGNHLVYVGLCIAAALAAPWYLANTSETMDHLQRSGALEVNEAYTPWQLIRFQYLCLISRNLTWPLVPLFIVGVILSLWRRHEGMIAVLGLVIAHASYPLYFHARYAYPLSIYVALLAGITVAATGRKAVFLSTLIVLIGLLRIGGWMLVPNLPTQAMAETSNEAQEWYQGDWHEAFYVGDDPIYKMEGLFYTLPPSTEIDWVAHILNKLEAHCGALSPCAIYYHQPPMNFEAFAQMDSIYAYRYQRYFAMASSQLKPVDTANTYAKTLTYLIFERDEDLQTWLNVHGDIGWDVLEHEEELLNMQGLILQSHLTSPQPRSHAQPFQWDAR